MLKLHVVKVLQPPLYETATAFACRSRKPFRTREIPHPFASHSGEGP